MSLPTVVAKLPSREAPINQQDSAFFLVCDSSKIAKAPHLPPVNLRTYRLQLQDQHDTR
jgi:hypothetical protein